MLPLKNLAKIVGHLTRAATDPNMTNGRYVLVALAVLGVVALASFGVAVGLLTLHAL